MSNLNLDIAEDPLLHRRLKSLSRGLGFLEPLQARPSSSRPSGAHKAPLPRRKNQQGTSRRSIDRFQTVTQAQKPPKPVSPYRVSSYSTIQNLKSAKPPSGLKVSAPPNIINLTLGGFQTVSDSQRQTIVSKPKISNSNNNQALNQLFHKHIQIEKSGPNKFTIENSNFADDAKFSLLLNMLAKPLKKFNSAGTATSILKLEELKVKNAMGILSISNCNIKSSKFCQLLESFHGSSNLEMIEINGNKSSIKSNVILSLAELIKSMDTKSSSGAGSEKTSKATVGSQNKLRSGRSAKNRQVHLVI